MVKQQGCLQPRSLASLVSKSSLLVNWAKHNVKLKRFFMVSVGVVGIFLLVTPLLVNMTNVHKLSMASFLFFQVKEDQNVGYSFDVFSPTSQASLLTN
jgi:hypothetical protein